MARIYNQWLERFPLPTKAITSGVLFSIGDLLTQKFVEAKEFSWKRNLDFFLVGMVYMGPVLHYWYSKWLPAIASKLFSPTTNKAVKVIGSMTFQQLCFSPILMSLFYPVNQIVSERSPKALGRGIQAWREKIVETMQTNWKVWPLATTINLWLMPVQYQVLFANCVALFYNMFLSYIASK